MAKQVILLAKQVSGSSLTVSYICWYTILGPPVAANHGSVWSGRSPAEDLAIQNGTVLEETGSVTVPFSPTALTAAKALVNEIWAARAAQLSVPFLDYYGIFYDPSTGWSA